MKPSEIAVLFKEEWSLKVNKLIMSRQNQNYTQRDMAELTGRSLRTIVSFEQGVVFDPLLMFAYEFITEEQ